MPQVSVRQKETGSDDADVRGRAQVFWWRRNLGAHMACVLSKQSQMAQKHADLSITVRVLPPLD